MPATPEHPAPAAGAGQQPPPRIAFLLAQLGDHAAQGFARRAAELELTAAQAGLLRRVGIGPGQHQQELARQLSMSPSRFVAFVDALEERGLIERRRNPRDRRFQALYLTAAGEQLSGRLSAAALAHEESLCAGLDEGERRSLAALLGRVAGNQGLTSGVHPGYSRMTGPENCPPGTPPYPA